MPSKFEQRTGWLYHETKNSIKLTAKNKRRRKCKQEIKIESKQRVGWR